MRDGVLAVCSQCGGQKLKHGFYGQNKTNGASYRAQKVALLRTKTKHRHINFPLCLTCFTEGQCIC